MSTVKVTDIIRRVEDVLQDTNIRWPRTELQNWMNESYLAITLARPDANAKTGIHIFCTPVFVGYVPKLA